jgi:phosphoribosylaminoimidazolecarboxamide formyltransferase/IMP cyclohydrolase
MSVLIIHKPYKLVLTDVQELRYGENPHQSAAFYQDTHPVLGALANYHSITRKRTLL